MKKNPLKVLIAPDKFKGSLSAKEVCEAIASGLNQKEESLEIIFHPMADGGDDSLTILADHLALEEVIVDSQDPLGRTITAKYFTSNDAAFIEVASASGLVLLAESERNPLHTSTLGTGMIILDAISKGHQNIYLFLGGSATNDTGMGIAQALGFSFLDKENNILTPVGGNLSKVVSIKNNNLFDFNEIKISVFYDVLNPLYGKNGAAYIYAPQKGGTAEEVQYLDSGLINFSTVLLQHTNIDVSTIAGGGSAGGIGAGLVALCGARMGKGFELIAEITNLEERIKQSDWVISGEGRLDEQSLQGKVIDGIASLCKKHQKPLSLLVGKNDLSGKELLSLNVNQVSSISAIAKNQEDAMLNGSVYLEALAKELLLS
jgi:glycerate kinase